MKIVDEKIKVRALVAEAGEAVAVQDPLVFPSLPAFTQAPGTNALKESDLSFVVLSTNWSAFKPLTKWPCLSKTIASVCTRSVLTRTTSSS